MSLAKRYIALEEAYKAEVQANKTIKLMYEINSEHLNKIEERNVKLKAENKELKKK